MSATTNSRDLMGDTIAPNSKPIWTWWIRAATLTSDGWFSLSLCLLTTRNKTQLRSYCRQSDGCVRHLSWQSHLKRGFILTSHRQVFDFPGKKILGALEKLVLKFSAAMDTAPITHARRLWRNLEADGEPCRTLKLRIVAPDILRDFNIWNSGLILLRVRKWWKGYYEDPPG